MLWLSTVLAAPWAEIDAVWEAGREVGSSVSVTVDGQPAERGMDLEPGARIEVGAEAQLRLVYADGDQVVLYEETTVTLGEESLLQELGSVLLDLEGAFRVLYGEVEAAVEGTRYTVEGTDEGVIVSVAEGAVRVSAGGEEVLVTSGQSTTVTTTPSPPAETARWRPEGLGPPRTQLGLAGGSAWVLGDPHAELRMTLRRRISPGWQLTLSGGLETSGQRFHVPATLGVERRFWRTAVGVEALFFIGQEQSCEEVRTLVKPGGSAVGRVVLARPGPLELALAGRIGFVDGLYAHGAVEVAFAL